MRAPPETETAAGARGTNSSADGGDFKQHAATANAKAVGPDSTTADQLVAILVQRYALSVPYARVVAEQHFGAGGGHD